MKNKLSITLLFFLFLIKSSAQAPLYCKAWPVLNGGQIFDTYTDNNNNFYATGHYYYNTIIGADTLTSISNDAFIVKYNAAGNPLWARGATGNTNDQANGVCSDKWGNVYITGDSRSDTLYFGNYGLLVKPPGITVGKQDGFLAKYDSSGNFQWARSMYGTGTNICKDVVCDSLGNVFIAGYFNSDTLIFDSLHSVISVNGGSHDMFAAKYDGTGNLVWTFSPQGSGSDVGIRIAADNNNNIYVAGQTASYMLYAGNDTVYNAGGNGEVIVIKLDNNGNVLWAGCDGSNTVSTMGCNGMSIDSDKNIYLTGVYLQDTATFAGDTLYPLGGYNYYVAKFNSTGVPVWAKNATGCTFSYGENLIIDTHNNLLVTGLFGNGNIILGNNQLNLIGTSDFFVAKYDSSGNVMWAKNSGISLLGIQTWSISCDKQDNIYVAGDYDNTVLTLDTIMLPQPQNNGCFIAEICGTPTYITKTDSPEIDVVVYPNPAINNIYIKSASENITDIEVADISGRSLFNGGVKNKRGQIFSIDISTLKSGVYFLKCYTHKSHTVIKFIKQ